MPDPRWRKEDGLADLPEGWSILPGPLIAGIFKEKANSGLN